MQLFPIPSSTTSSVDTKLDTEEAISMFLEQGLLSLPVRETNGVFGDRLEQMYEPHGLEYSLSENSNVQGQTQIEKDENPPLPHQSGVLVELLASSAPPANVLKPAPIQTAVDRHALSANTDTLPSHDRTPLVAVHQEAKSTERALFGRPESASFHAGLPQSDSFDLSSASVLNQNRSDFSESNNQLLEHGDMSLTVDAAPKTSQHDGKDPVSGPVNNQVNTRPDVVTNLGTQATAMGAHAADGTRQLVTALSDEFRPLAAQIQKFANRENEAPEVAALASPGAESEGLLGRSQAEGQGVRSKQPNASESVVALDAQKSSVEIRSQANHSLLRLDQPNAGEPSENVAQQISVSSLPHALKPLVSVPISNRLANSDRDFRVSPSSTGHRIALTPVAQPSATFHSTTIPNFLDSVLNIESSADITVDGESLQTPQLSFNPAGEQPTSVTSFSALAPFTPSETDSAHPAVAKWSDRSDTIMSPSQIISRQSAEGPDATPWTEHSARPVAVSHMLSDDQSTQTRGPLLAGKNVTASIENGVIERIATALEMRFAARNPEHSEQLRIQLQPEELGSVDVVFRKEGNMRVAEILVADEAARQIVESRVELLQENLRHYDVQQVRIEFAGSESHSNLQNGARHRDDHQKPPGRKHDALNHDVIENSDSNPAAGRIDVVA